MVSRKLRYWSLTVALAGFLFGFDTIVISGAEQSLQELWNRGDVFHGWVVMSSALWGTVIGALFGNIPTDKFGRKRTLFFIGILYFISAVGSALAGDPWMFAIFRFIGGIGVGTSTIAAPAYVSEIAPAKDRGKLVALYQFNIVFGILVAFMSNWLFTFMEGESWRWMIGVEALPALIYTLMVLTVPRSPRWLLIQANEYEEAKHVFEQINPDVDADIGLKAILDQEAKIGTKQSVWNGKYNFPLMLAFFIAFFNQFSGINAFLYYAPRIFETAGLAEKAAFLGGVGIGAINLIFTLFGLALIDRFGRKQLMYIGSVGYIVSLILVTAAFQFEWTGLSVPFFLFIFIASHAIGQGTVIWVFISEIFPNQVRAGGTSFGVSTHWVLAAFIPAMVPWLFSNVGVAPVFGFFAFMMVLQLLWVYRYMPETKGKSLEELEEEFVK